MKHTFKYISILLIIVISACNSGNNSSETSKQNESIFPKGEKIASNNFSGTVWVQMMGANDSTLYARFGNVTFEPKARTNWHSHPGGQVLFITKGKGYYQALGQPAQLLNKGDVVEIPRDVVHWHGAAPDSEFAHIAISLNSDEGNVVWLGPVTDEEYKDLNINN
ncbi:cupin domain-containing protein [Maribellus maritimus]|uniref:cupin domain-containing protein n=1 Tax=Maribellus maritimus TaxID=2870838 RepID=UPI001EEB86F9|nr:cupin domain-containing protein [Maribellus maritimus]MCG6189973.1 cupin domain-containing protein [Maribellus maritimus]